MTTIFEGELTKLQNMHKFTPTHSKNGRGTDICQAGLIASWHVQKMENYCNIKIKSKAALIFIYFWQEVLSSRNLAKFSSI